MRDRFTAIAAAGSVSGLMLLVAFAAAWEGNRILAPALAALAAAAVLLYARAVRRDAAGVAAGVCQVLGDIRSRGFFAAIYGESAHIIARDARQFWRRAKRAESHAAAPRVTAQARDAATGAIVGRPRPRAFHRPRVRASGTKAASEGSGSSSADPPWPALRLPGQVLQETQTDINTVTEAAPQSARACA